MILRTLIAAVAMTILRGPGALAQVPADPAFTACPLPGVTETGRCGFITVPEDRTRPTGRSIRLHVMILPALDGSGREAPLFDLAGGPGEPAGNSAGFYAVDGAPYRAKRDIVLVDARGTGQFGALACPDLKPASPIAPLYPPAAVRACRETLSRDHDLSQYTTRATAEDMETVRAALGYDRIDIFGLSYGTMLAQTYLRLFPERVRAAVLVGTVPLGEPLPLHHGVNAEPLVAQLIAACGDDAGCRTAYPDLPGDWTRLLAQFADGSAIMKDRAGAEVRVERGPFMEALRATLTTSAGQARLPLVIHRTAAGDLSPLQRGDGGGPSLAEGLYLSVTCAEGTDWITPTEAAATSNDSFLGRYRVDEQVGACLIWDVPKVRGDALPPPGPTPVLFMAGGRDHVTPPAWARRVATDYRRGAVVIIAPLSHGIEGVEGIDCFDQIALAFFAAGGSDGLDTGCTTAMSAPPFVIAP